jgi:hypothetical protein
MPRSAVKRETGGEKARSTDRQIRRQSDKRNVQKKKKREREREREKGREVIKGIGH